MAHYHQEWDDLGRNIQDLVDRAVNSHDYRRLSQAVQQTVERAVDMGSEAVRKVTSGTGRPIPEPREEKKLPVLYGSPKGKQIRGVLKVTGGSVLSLFSLPSVLVSGVYSLVFGGAALPGMLSLVGLVGGLWLLGAGVRDLGRVKRFKLYLKTLGQKTHCTLEKLAKSVGKSVGYVRREVRRMIGEGLFLQGHLDKEETSLITSDETYNYYEQSRLQLEHRQRQEAKEAQAAKERAQREKESVDPQLQEVLDRGNAFIAKIRACNDAIPGEEISGKISRMEEIVRRIFLRAKEHPEIVPDLKKLMDYYLPMTVKLLDAYADMDAQPIQGETILASKQEIEDTLDTLNQAFEKLLDDLYKETALDVSSDISVLNTLLAQEGLTEDELTKMKKEKTF